MTAAGALARGRASFDRREWSDAFAALTAADREAPLGPGDVERLATVAYLLGRDDDSIGLWERAHHAHLGAGGAERAARCAFWLAVGLLERGDVAPGGGWIARARRLLDECGHDCAEPGYLLLPVARQRVADAFATFRGDKGYELPGIALTAVAS